MMLSQILRELIAAGLQGDALVLAVERIEQSMPKVVDATAERRRAKDRERYHMRKPPTPPKTTELHNDSYLLTSSSDSKETKKEERKKERVRKWPLPATWKPNAEHYAEARKYGLPDSYVEQKALDMRRWANSKGVMRPGWDDQFFIFLKPDGKGFNGHAPRPGSKEDTRERTVNALRALDPFPDSHDFEGSESPRSPVSGFLPFPKSS